MRPSTVLAIENEDASDNNIESDPIKTEFVVMASLQAVSTGTSTGTVKIQVSNDPITAVPTNWTDLSGATVNVTAASKVIIPKYDSCYNWTKIVYTKNNGDTGTLSVNFKSIGY